MGRISLSLAVTAVLALSVLHSANGYCCNRRAPHIATHISFCADCTHTEWCCAGGSCNIFCCNCDGGCRQGTCWNNFDGGRKRDVSSALNANETLTSGHTVVQEGDVDGDGRLSVDEAHALLERRGAPASRYRGKRDLHALDVDADNYLSPSEIDRDAEYDINE